VVVVGGAVPAGGDYDLKANGVSAVFGPGATSWAASEILALVANAVTPRGVAI
jgi:methylmalonyl-CoA mutase cobalamin-binding subunit